MQSLGITSDQELTVTERLQEMQQSAKNKEFAFSRLGPQPAWLAGGCCVPPQTDLNSLCWLQQSHQAFETLSPHFPPPSQLSPPPTSPFLTLSLSRLVPYLSLPSRLATARFTICFYRPGSSSSSKMAAAELSSSCAQAAAAPTKVLGTRAPLTNDDRGIIASTCPVILHTLYTV